jgi:hypothetical protein
MPSKTEIVQAAIARCGSEVVNDLTLDVDEMVVVNATYDTIVEDYLCRHGWTFATRTTTIQKNGATPKKPWLYEFDLPGDRLNLRVVRRNGDKFIDFDLIEDKLVALCDDDLDIEYNWKASEARWPGDFAKCVQEALLATLLEAFEEATKADRVQRRADAMIEMAIRRDRRQKPGGRQSNSRLLRAWFGRRAGRAL